LTRTVDEKLRCCYRRNGRRSKVAGASSATKTLRRRAGRSISRHISGTRARRRHRPPYLRQSCVAYIKRVMDKSLEMWLQRGMRLGRGVFYAASTTNAYATVRRVAEERDPALEPSTVDFPSESPLPWGQAFGTVWALPICR